MGIGWSGSGDFSNASGATTTVATIPSGSYGPTPVVAVAIGVRGGDVTDPLDTHTVTLVLGSGTINLLSTAGCASGNRMGQGFVTEGGIPTGDLDGGGTVRVHTSETTTPSGPEQGTAVAVVLEFAATRDHGNWFFETYGSCPIVTDDVTGAMPTNPYTNDSTALYGLGLVGFHGAAAAPYTISWEGAANWTDVVERTNGSAFAQIAIWNRPGTLNTDVEVSDFNTSGGVVAANGVCSTISFGDAVPVVVAARPARAMLVG